MGNSGSLNSIPGFDENYHQANYHQLHYHQSKYQDFHHNHLHGHHSTPPASWLPQYSREPPSQNQQIKVLPEIPVNVPKLRSTNNGHILHAGGTISKNNLQRSKSISSPNYQQHQDQVAKSLPPHMQMIRSRTQIQMVTPKSYESSSQYRKNSIHDIQTSTLNRNPKKFGSAPDLRQQMASSSPSSDYSNEDNPMVMKNTKVSVQSKILKGKQKKKAPNAPMDKSIAQEPEKTSRIMAYSPLRKTNSDTSSTLPPKLNDGQPKKLRLFKTRAESKKLPTKLPEYSDAKFNGKLSPPVMKPKNFVQKENSLDKVTEKQKSHNPISFFRREKTFDIGILSDSKKKSMEPIPKVKPLSPPLFQRKIATKLQPSQIMKTKMEPPKKTNLLPMQPMTDFQKELKLATKKKSIAACTIAAELNKRKLSEFKAEPERQAPTLIIDSKKDPTPPPPLILPTLESTQTKIVVPPSPKLQPAKKCSPYPAVTTFYFGMEDKKSENEPIEVEKSMPIIEVNYADSKHETDDDDEEMDKTQLDVIDKFAASLLNAKKFNSTDSMASSDIDDRMTSGAYNLDENDNNEISLKLRPTLPRKQCEIPRFSPAAAWRLLTTEDDFGKDSHDWIHYEKKTLVRSVEGAETNNTEESRIERIYREPGVPGIQDNKSGDSGISGDAGPDIADASLSKANALTENNNQNNWSTATKIQLTPWTPQQDLEEDDDATGSSVKSNQIENENEFTNKGHLFSFSLPRENHLSIYGPHDKVEKHVFHSLQKLRRTVSDVFTSENNNESATNPIESSDNWFFSRTETTSYEKRQLSPVQQRESKFHASLGNLMSGRHFMYFPKESYSKQFNTSDNIKTEIEVAKNDVNNNSHHKEETKESIIASEPMKEELEYFPLKISKNGKHKFTFQSTIRQVEKRRVAEKLSKEAEFKEAQRLNELEVMKRVEEEFQKKRAREKASIRHQLRLFSLEENQSNEDTNLNEHEIRSDPDGDSSTAQTSLPYQSNATTNTYSRGIYKKNSFDNEKIGKRIKPSNIRESRKILTDEIDDECTSSISYKDTRTPYISRIIKQKSSKITTNC